MTLRILFPYLLPNYFPMTPDTIIIDEAYPDFVSQNLQLAKIDVQRE